MDIDANYLTTRTQATYLQMKAFGDNGIGHTENYSHYL